MRTKVLILAVAIASLSLAFYLVSRSSDRSGAVQYRVVTQPPQSSTRTPSGCDIVSGEHRILTDGDGDPPAEPSWIPTQYSFCQLPKSWREAVRHTRVGEEVEYVVPAASVPTEIAGLLQVPPGRDLNIAFRTQSIDDPPEGLKFPSIATIPEDAQKTALGVRYVLIAADQIGPEVTEQSAVAVHYSFWRADGTLVATSYLSPTPAVLTVAKTDSFVRELLLAAEHEGDRLVAWLPAALAQSQTPVLLDASIEKVFR